VPTRPVFATVGTMSPLSHAGAGFMVGPSPTLAAPLPDNSAAPRQVEEVPNEFPQQMQDDEPAGTGVLPRQLPPQAPADLMPTAADDTTRGEKRARWGEMPSQPATRAVSAEARFVEL